MTKKVLAACALFLLIMVVIARYARHPAGGPSGGDEAPEVGHMAPSFKLPDLDGHSVSLEDFRGKIVMLDFWATWCGPCRLTMPVLEKLQKEYSKDLVLLAVNLGEEPESVRSYVKAQNITSTVLLDQDGNVGQAYQSESIPMQVVIDKKGVVRRVTVGYSSRLADQLRSAIEDLR